ncbi:MAG: integral rane protein [Frankiales bacterium]|nr:integral rane protein [Frankiales bacterium]
MTEPPSWSSPGGEPSGSLPAPAPAPPAGAWHGQSGYGYGPPAHQPGVIPLRPLALGELLDGAIKIIRRYPRPTLGLSAAIALVVTILNVIAVVVLNNDFSIDSSGNTFNGSDVALNVGSTGVPAVFSFLAGLVLTGALISVVGKAVQGLPTSTSEVWAAVRPRIWALLGLSLLTGLLVVAPILIGVGLAIALGVGLGPGGLVIGIPLGFASAVLSAYLYVRLALASPALVLEKASITASLRRSGVLVKGSWWRVFGILILSGIIAGIVASIISAIVILPAAILTSVDGTASLVAQQVAGGIASVLLSPFSAGVRALLYVDRRMRAEGLDVALQAAVADGSAG